MNTRQPPKPHNKPPQKEPQKGTFDFTKLPPHACSYCGIHGIENVVQCLDCDKWFCNNKYNKQKESDIVLHMLISRHGALGVLNSPTGKILTLQCEDCSRPNTDPFCLSVLFAKTDNSLHVYCTDYLANDRNAPKGEWELLLQEKRLSTWMIPRSLEKDLQKARQLTRNQINRLESLWKDGVNIKFENMQDEGFKPKREYFLKSVQDSYSNVEEYLRIYLPLIEAEAESDKQLRSTWGQNNVPIQWDTKKGDGFQENVPVEFEYTKHKCYAYLSCDNEKYFDGRLTPSDKLEISQGRKGDKTYWSAEGLIKYVKDEEICLVFPKSSRPQGKISTVNVRYVWMSVTYDRMTNSLLRMPNEYQHSAVLRYIIRPPKPNTRKVSEEQKEDPIDPRDLYYESLLKIKENNIFKALDKHCAKMPYLNDSQIEAIKLAQSDWPVVSIQGPPGTGKTVTLTTIIKLLTLNLSKKKKILCCAPSNVAVDHITENLMKLGVDVLRIYSKSRENLEEGENPRLDPVSLHKKIRKMKGTQGKLLREYLDQKADGVWLDINDEKKYRNLYEQAEREMIAEAQVICCTCITAGGLRPSNYTFEYVAIDEAAQAVEPETLIPILYGAKKVFLVGDHKQLGPVITCKQATGAKFEQSLFERLALAVKPYRLNVQYRMHPEIAAFPSKWFYDNELLTSREIKRPISQNFPWPNRTKPKFFYNVVGKEEIPPSRISLMNRQEAEVVKQAINRVAGTSVKSEQIGVITPYRGQKMLIHQMQKRGEIPQGIEVASVNEFQGREKDYIIISCVRSNVEVGIGFLMDKRRLNVALTRAKYGLIICGNAQVLTQDQIWRELIIEYNQEGLIFEGDFRNLKKSNIEIKKTAGNSKPPAT